MARGMGGLVNEPKGVRMGRAPKRNLSTGRTRDRLARGESAAELAAHNGGSVSTVVYAFHPG
jgi:hypothetical protein